jgi:hypothetical protein
MDTFDILIILLLILLTYTLLKRLTNNSIEKLESVESTGFVEDPLKKTKSITHPIDLLQDNAFSDVVFYRSGNIIGMETGLQKCMENCVGTCQLFGHGFDAMCFPRQ